MSTQVQPRCGTPVWDHLPLVDLTESSSWLPGIGFHPASSGTRIEAPDLQLSLKSSLLEPGHEVPQFGECHLQDHIHILCAAIYPMNSGGKSADHGI